MLYLYTGLGMPDRYCPTDEEHRFTLKHIEMFPHCDSLILHRRGTCEHCDAHPDWQALRIAWEINFTGETDPLKAPCPSSKYRPAYQAHQWPHNRPTAAVVPLQPPTAWERLDKDDEK